MQAWSLDHSSPERAGPKSYRRLIVSSGSKIDSLNFDLRRSIKWNVIFWLNRLPQINFNFPSTNIPLTKKNTFVNISLVGHILNKKEKFLAHDTVNIYVCQHYESGGRGNKKSPID